MTAGEYISAHRGAANDDIRPGCCDVCSVEGQCIIAAAAAVANQLQSRSVVMIDGTQFRIADRHIAVQHNRGATFEIRRSAIQTHERGRIIHRRDIDQHRRRVFLGIAIARQPRIRTCVALIVDCDRQCCRCIGHIQVRNVADKPRRRTSDQTVERSRIAFQHDRPGHVTADD